VRETRAQQANPRTASFLPIAAGLRVYILSS
jgi:hypothetical protein